MAAFTAKPTMVIVHAADLHLDSPLRGLPCREGDDLAAFQFATRRTLKRLVDRCLAERAALLLLCGDLLDASNRDHKSGLFFVEQMQRLESIGTQVRFLRGNHDAASRIVRCWLLPDFVREVGLDKPTTERFDHLGVVLHGAGYRERSISENLLSGYPEPHSGYVNVGMLHTSAEGREGHELYAPCTRRQLKARGYDYFALGHVHRFEVLSTVPWVAFSGCLQGRNIREPGPRGAVVVSVEHQRVCEVSFVALDVVRFDTLGVRLDSAGSLESIQERINLACRTRLGEPGPRAWVLRVMLSGTDGLCRLLSEPAARRTRLVRAALGTGSKTPVLLESIWAEVEGPLATHFRLDLPGEIAERR